MICDHKTHGWDMLLDRFTWQVYFSSTVHRSQQTRAERACSHIRMIDSMHISLIYYIDTSAAEIEHKNKYLSIWRNQSTEDRLAAIYDTKIDDKAWLSIGRRFGDEH